MHLKRIGIAAILLTAISSWVIAGGGVAKAKKTTIPCHIKKVFVDYEVGLMWQDEAFTPQEDGAYMTERSYGKAGTHAYAVRYCKNLNYAGFDDWRLPTAEELVGMHRIPKQPLAYFRDGDFWTSTPAGAGKYYVVFPADAYRYKRNPRKSYYIRCVRCIEPR
jgi:hypothetical protein